MVQESGAITPLSTSSTSTLNNPSPKQDVKNNVDKLTQPDAFLSPSTPSGASLVTSASAVIESLAARNSSIVYLYDTARQVGIGELTESWSTAGAIQAVELQSRTGAGLIIAGRLGQSTSTHTGNGGTLSAFANPEGLAQMVPTLGWLPIPSAAGRVVIQVPALSATPDYTPSLAAFTTSLSLVPDNFAVILSATTKESVDLASLSYGITEHHVIHIFDQYAAARETRKITYPKLPQAGSSLDKELAAAGHSFFDYSGSLTAEVVIVALKGPLGSALEALAKHIPNLGVVTVRVLRPWDGEKLRAVTPPTAKTVHVLADMLQPDATSPLFEDVFGALLEANIRPAVQHHGITPSRLGELIASTSALETFVSETTGLETTIRAQGLLSPTLKKLLFLGTPSVPLATLPDIIAHSFMTHPSIEARLLTDYDAYSQAGGVTASRLFLGSENSATSNELPANLILPLGEGLKSTADFVAILDDGLVKTHDIFKSCRPNSFVLLYSKWSTEEVLANLPVASLELIRDKSLSLYTLNTSEAAANLLQSKKGENKQVLENVLGHLAFLRIYVGIACTEQSLEKVGTALFGETVGTVGIKEIVGYLWENILQVIVPLKDQDDVNPADDVEVKPLRSFEFNAVELASTRGAESDGQQAAAMATKQDAAKHLAFREAFHLPLSKAADTTAQHPSLRPDLEDRTYQVVCAVNRRLTPLAYDRNVFHLEFDTNGTGLKYDIGEALGVHGWNDETDIKDFCEWYGLDPDALVTIPVPTAHRPTQNGVPLEHTRTVFQALQQQIDIFGKPPKSFYTDLSEYATKKEHRMALMFIGSAEGAETLKKLSEVDTVTFAEVFAMFDSARPDFAKLCELVGDIKPRHYSIASAQSAVGNRVDLLVVTVDWVNPSGGSLPLGHREPRPISLSSFQVLHDTVNARGTWQVSILARS